MRLLPRLSALLAAVGVAAGIFWLSFGYFQSQELSRAEGQLSLYRSTLLAELQRFSHLTHILARDPFVISTSLGADTGLLNERLRNFAEVARIDAIYLMGRNGVTISASNAQEKNSFVGQTYSFRPYFRMALRGEHGHFYGIGATTGLPGYFLADAVRDDLGVIIGVLAIKIDLSKLEQRWREAGQQVLVANGDGVILLASEPDWRYRLLKALGPEQEARIAASKQFAGKALTRLDWVPRAMNRARVEQHQRLHLTSSALPHSWTLHYFASDDAAIARSWLVTGLAIMVAGLAFILMQRQRTRRMGAALARSEQEEALLRQANERLAVEIAERRVAEQQLTKAQGELERASRLAALGRLAALVTHELGQPIAAMRNHIAAAEMTNKADAAVTDRLSGLIDRMEHITRQLKFFARTDKDDFDDIDLIEALQSAIGLVESNLRDGKIQMICDWPKAPLRVRGNRYRLEQVLTNLLRNAADALEETEKPVIAVTMGETPQDVWLEICDNGHGLGEASLVELAEPFVTTRESGRGMGLGLAISAGIIKDHDGEMTARNGVPTGAVFRVTFPAIHPETTSPRQPARTVPPRAGNPRSK